VPYSLARKPRWLTHTLQGEKADPKTSFQVSHPPKNFPNYFAVMSAIVDAEPSSYEEAASEKVWLAGCRGGGV